jgi:SAM-dependent methyltransferase
MQDEPYAESLSTHYGEGDLTGRILDALRAAGKDVGPTPDDLAPLDQFHIGGKETTRQLAERAGLDSGQSVLDVGGGIGGPARTLAGLYGCHVTVLDLTEAYCRAGEMLTDLTGLSDRVSFRHGNALDLPFPGEAFDLVWTQHSSMNIKDKERLYAEIHRVLRPGGRLALHEIMAGPVQPVHFPVPWTRDPAFCFLRTPEEMRALLSSSGFAEIAWDDVTPSALAWNRNWAEKSAGMPPRPLGIHVLLGPEMPEMGRNMLRNLAEDRIVVIQAVLARP